MNAFTRAVLEKCFEREPHLIEKRADKICFTASMRYWDEIHGSIGYVMVLRAIRLYSLWRPECVSEEGLEGNYIDCDFCAQRLSEHMTEYMLWWIGWHPEYAYTDFTLEEAREVWTALQQRRLAATTYQMPLFG